MQRVRAPAMGPWWLTVLVAATGSCGGGTSVPQIVSEYRSAVCAFSVRCGSALDQASCERSNDMQLVTAELTASLEAGRALRDEKLARRCFDLLSAAPCRTGALEDLELDEACGGAFPGAVPAGAPCAGDQECVGHGACKRDDRCAGIACCPGICAAAPVRTTSGSCGSNRDCVRSHFCDRTRVCKPRLADGEACRNNGCGRNSACTASDLGVCAPLAADGESCRQVGCDSLLSVCDPVSRLCKLRGTTGQPCTPGFLPAGSCLPYLQCLGGTCGTGPAVGEACSPASGSSSAPPQCQTGRCLDGICAAPPSLCGAGADAGYALDTSLAPAPDTRAAPDTSVASDAGPTPDTSVASDAGPTPDTSVAPDIGAAPDAPAGVDAGGGLDASLDSPAPATD